MYEADDPAGGTVQEKAFHYFSQPQPKDLDLFIFATIHCKAQNKPFLTYSTAKTK